MDPAVNGEREGEKRDGQSDSNGKRGRDSGKKKKKKKSARLPAAVQSSLLGLMSSQKFGSSASICNGCFSSVAAPDRRFTSLAKD